LLLFSISLNKKPFNAVLCNQHFNHVQLTALLDMY